MTRASRSGEQPEKAQKKSARRRVKHWLARTPLTVKIAALMLAIYFGLSWLTKRPSLDLSILKPSLWLALTAVVVGAVLLARRLRWERLHKIIQNRLARGVFDERRILSDLSYAARTVATRAELFELIVGRIREALDPPSVAVFVRDDETQDYRCEIFSDLDAAGTPQNDYGSAAQFARDAFVIRRLGRLSAPLTIGAADFESWARAPVSFAPAKREARRRERATLEQVGASLMLPVMMKDELVGVLTLGARRNGKDYTPDDKQLLLAIAGQLAFIIENTKLAARIVAEESLRRELQMASDVQRRLFPERAPESDWLEFSGFCQPARGVGGDYYDFLALDENLTGVAVADVAGKGIAAALLMSIVQASLRSQAASVKDGSLAQLTANMNQLMYGSTDSASYATFFYAQCDARTRRLTYVNAGHNPPLLWRAARGQITSTATMATTDLKLEKLTVGGPVIGLLNNCFYEQGAVEIESGDVLLAYTDGVTESFNVAGEEFGEERLEQALAECAQLSAEEIRAAIVRRVSAWSAGAPQHDDLTVVIMKVK